MTKSKAVERAGRPLVTVMLLVAALLALGVDAARRFEVSTSMEHFLPGQGERQLYRVSRQVIDSTLTGRMVLTIGQKNAQLSRDQRRENLRRFTQALTEELSESDGFGSFTSGPPPKLEETFFELYFPRRFAFFSLTPDQDAKKLNTPSELGLRAQRLKGQLAGPQGVFARRIATQDPWLFFMDFLQNAEKNSVRLDIDQGAFFASPRRDSPTGVGPDEDFAIVFAELKESALDSTAQRPVLDALHQAFARIKKEEGPSFVLEASGANRFAVATEASMKSDIELVFSLSTVGLLLVFLAFFRSLGRVLYLVLPIISGLVCALWVSLITFGQVHALTLAFGGALIGIAIDYPVHVLCHHDLDRRKVSGAESARRIRPTLSLAAGTTVVGLVGLAGASFPGIREIAVFSCVGVVAALVTTLLTTSLLPESGTGPRLATNFATKLEQLLRQVRGRRAAPWILVGATCLIAIAGLRQVSFAPGLDSLAPLDEQLLAEDARVQARMGDVDGGKLAIAIAPTVEKALLVNERIARELQAAQNDGLLKQHMSVTTLLRSRALQQQSQNAITRAPGIADKTRKALGKNGFRPDQFSQLEQELKAHAPPLTLDQVKKSALGSMIEPFIFPAGDEIAVITPLSGLTDEDALSARIDAIEGAHFFSQRALLNQAYGDLRSRTTQLLLIGLLLVFLAALIRYRDWKKSTAALLPSVLASATTIGLLSLAGVEINLLHLLGLLLVCSMGVDYGVFLVDSEKDHTGPALLSITVGCLSTMMSFGALALSSAPALSALGSSIGIGIVLSLIIAPAAFLLIRPLDPSRST